MKSSILLTATVSAFLLFAGVAAAQSTSQDFPTAVTANELSGTIKARDIGDARLTTYFYTFNGDQGDLFINIVTTNFTGDLDIFTAAGLRPVTKIVIYASDSENETGRAVYFRKPERLLLRIQGRTPNDDPASFKIKFAGSFAALSESDVANGPELPKVNAGRDNGNRVNSVGTLLPPVPRPPLTEDRKDTVSAAKENVPTDEAGAASSPAVPSSGDVNAPSKGREAVETGRPADVPAAAPARRTAAGRRKRVPPVTTAKTTPSKTAVDATPSETPPPSSPGPKRSAKKAKEPVPDPLASVRLVISFKDGNAIEKTMNEVFKFSVDKGILTVILKNGTVGRYPIADVAKVTIE